jgi:hypothetical protein
VLVITGRWVDAIDVPSGHVRAIVPTSARDIGDPDGMVIPGIAYVPCGISKDGKKLLVKFSIVGPTEVEGNLKFNYQYAYVRSIDLETGLVKTIAKTKDTNGIDWLPSHQNVAAKLTNRNDKPVEKQSADGPHRHQAKTAKAN